MPCGQVLTSRTGWVTELTICSYEYTREGLRPPETLTNGTNPLGHTAVFRLPEHRTSD